MKLLLHCCCAPCAIGCTGSLHAENIELDLFWYNPNIHPFTEYTSRHDCLVGYANEENIKITDINEYGLRRFLKEAPLQRELRCETCYRMRLEKTASLAAQEKYDAFSTTLLISPYQNHEVIRRIGEEAAAKYGVEFLYMDFRPSFREGQAAARGKKMYMQKYCGCVFSEEEKNLSKPESSPAFPAPLENSFDRISLLIGRENFKILQNKSVLVFGAGGVGSWAAEALARSGIGKIGIIDNDVICASNINRQVEATTLTLGLPKASALKKRLLEINPDCEITAWDELFCRENASVFKIENADYVIDAIDTLNHKLDLIETVCGAGVTLFSSMGMALKIDPAQIKTASVWKTDNCPLARLVRQGLRKRGFTKDFTVVYSSEQIIRAEEAPHVPGEKTINGSLVTVTASAGFMLATLVLQDILQSIQRAEQ